MANTLYGMITVSTSCDYTQLALSTFFRHTQLDETDQFVLIDNDGEWSQNWHMDVLSPDQIHLNTQPMNTSQNINQLIHMADEGHRDLVFLSNDVVFTPRWHQRLIMDPQVLSVPSCNQTHDYGFPQSLSLLEFGGRFGALNVAAHTHAAKERQPYETLLMPTYVCRIPRQLYQAVGEFDTAFNVGGEDVDYRLRLLQKGFTIKYCSSYLLHFNGRSSWNGAETNSQTQLRNRLYMQNFINKWGEDLFNLCVTGGVPQLTVDKFQLAELVSQGRYNQMILEVLNRRDSTETNIPKFR
jgi:hypothetical protein